DIGAGTGYMSLRLADRVPNGTVWAEDVQPEMVEILRDRMSSSGIDNVRPVQGDERSPGLEAQSIDLALMVDVYHELLYPREMLDAVSQALKPGGKIVLAEYKAENPRVMIKPLHKMSQSQVRAELEAAGFQFRRNIKGLPQQHLMLFEKSNQETEI
ncbi:MAG: class I SAM-dependent methyltransferase, partial [Cyanobacteria bacterium P01_F01_bin.42]